MDDMREIGHCLQTEHNLTSDDITWLTIIAQAILRAFLWDAGQPMRTLATCLGVSPQTLYTTLRLAIQDLMCWTFDKLHWTGVLIKSAISCHHI